MITNILIVLYFLIAFIFHLGIYNEYKKDTDPEMKKFNAIFVQVALLGSAICWPLLLGIAVYQKIKENK